MFHQNIRLPGVYFFNSNASTNKGMQGAPVFCTMDNDVSLQALGMNDADENVLVFPKYKILIYTGALTATPNLTIDNTNGTKCIYQAGTNGASTCRVYYDNVEIENCFSTTGF